MGDLKIRVNNEDESEEVQELLFKLGYNLVNNIAYEKGFVVASLYSSGINFDYYADVKEITLPELRDMVVLERNSITDATHEDGGNKFYKTKSGALYHFFDGVWVDCSTFIVESETFKPIEKSKVEVKQDINKLKVEWFEKFLNGVKVQYRIGAAVGSETSQWSNLTWNALKNLQHSPIEFREAPKYVVLNGITFKDKESLLRHIANNYNLG